MPPVTILKVGGSLLGHRDLADRIGEAVASIERPLVIVGGGRAADVVRGWDRVHGLSDDDAHELALGALGLAAECVVRLCSGAEIAAGRGSAEEVWATGGLPVLDVARFLAREESATNRLPRSWAVTTDTLAARVAHHWPTERLILLKSRPRPAGVDWRAAAALGLVDPSFPDLAGDLDVEWVGPGEPFVARTSESP